MKREGWQHGVVRVNRNKLLRTADGEAARAAELLSGGAYATAPSKPTNASRSTGKCRGQPRCAECHDHPATTKARDKAKGAHKLRACDVALNHRLVSWRVVDGAASGTGVPDYKGASASAVLAYLAGGNSWHEDDDDDAAADLETTPPANGGLSDLYDLIVSHHHADAAAVTAGQNADPAHADNVAVGDTDAIEEQEQDTDGDEEDMGFCMVGITIAVGFSDGEEDWIVVEGIPST